MDGQSAEADQLLDDRITTEAARALLVQCEQGFYGFGRAVRFVKVARCAAEMVQFIGVLFNLDQRLYESVVRRLGIMN